VTYCRANGSIQILTSVLFLQLGKRVRHESTHSSTLERGRVLVPRSTVLTVRIPLVYSTRAVPQKRREKELGARIANSPRRYPSITSIQHSDTEIFSTWSHQSCSKNAKQGAPEKNFHFFKLLAHHGIGFEIPY
jgi:hypothetical protein